MEASPTTPEELTQQLRQLAQQVEHLHGLLQEALRLQRAQAEDLDRLRQRADSTWLWVRLVAQELGLAFGVRPTPEAAGTAARPHLSASAGAAAVRPQDPARLVGAWPESDPGAAAAPAEGADAPARPGRREEPVTAGAEGVPDGPVDEEVKLLFRYAEQEGLRDKQLAELVGVSEKAISFWRLGVRPRGASRLLIRTALARVGWLPTAPLPAAAGPGLADKAGGAGPRWSGAQGRPGATSPDGGEPGAP